LLSVRRAALLAAALSGDDDPLDLTTGERTALIALLKRTLEYARYPLAPRLDPLEAILAKLDPPAPRPEPLPPIKAGMTPRRGQVNLKRLAPSALAHRGTAAAQPVSQPHHFDCLR
jgi:hypothetical protein